MAGVASQEVIKLRNILEGEEVGEYRANDQFIGWQGETKRQVLYPVAAVKKAEWLDGKLRVLCEEDNGEETVLALDGFATKDFDTLWRHFEKHCGVFLKKHQIKTRIAGEDFDQAMSVIAAAATLVDEAKASVQKKAREADLMTKVEVMRDVLAEVISGDKLELSRVFSADGCARIGALRLVVDTVNLEVYQTDPRWKDLLSKAASIEGVLRELGTFKQWKPPADSAMAKRQLVYEMRLRLGDEPQVSETPVERTAVVEDPLASSTPKPINPLAKTSDPLSDSRGAQQASLPPFLLGKEWPGSAQAKPPVQEEEKQEEEEEEVPEQSPPTADPLSKAKTEDPGFIDEEIVDPTNRRASPDGEEIGAAYTQDGARNPKYVYEGSLLEGWVWKRSRILRRWRRRYLVLTPESLSAYKEPRSFKPTECISKGEVSRSYPADSELQVARSFCVSTVQRRNYYMVADDEEQKRVWISWISRTLERTST